MQKIFEAVQREVDKQQFNFGNQDYESIPNTKAEIYKQTVLERTRLHIAFESTGLKNWAEVLMIPFSQALKAETDYERRPELIKLAATVINWIDCLDRNNRCIEPELTKQKFTDNDLMPFGQYKGYKLSAVPPEHLLIALENNFVDGLLKEYIVENKKKLESKLKTPNPVFNLDNATENYHA